MPPASDSNPPYANPLFPAPAQRWESNRQHEGEKTLFDKGRTRGRREDKGQGPHAKTAGQSPCLHRHVWANVGDNFHGVWVWGWVLGPTEDG